MNQQDNKQERDLKNCEHFQPIMTERLMIRRFTREDGESLYKYLSKEEAVKFEPYEVLSREAAYTEAKRRAKDPSFYAVCMKDGRLIGNLYFAEGDFDVWELGYVFHPAIWGHGYATESAKALMEHAFNVCKVRKIVAYCDIKNTASWKLLERLGMERESYIKKNLYFKKDPNGNPIWIDSLGYGKLNESLI